MKITASPLAWPLGWKRTANDARVNGQFGKLKSDGSMKVHTPLSVADAVLRVRYELSRINIADDDIVLSTNLKLRLDGFPRSDQRAPNDPGAAVYWADPWTGKPRSMAIDRYQKVEHNIAALAATLEAMRAIERHGGAAVIERAFSGFVALPAPIAVGESRPWNEVLEVDCLAEAAEVRAAYLRLRSKMHPDKGGTVEAFAELTRAHDEALKEISHGL